MCSAFVLYMHLITLPANLHVVLNSHEESDKCPTKFIVINFRSWLAFLWFYLRLQYQRPRSSGSGTNMAVLIKYHHSKQQTGITSFITFAYMKATILFLLISVLNKALFLNRSTCSIYNTSGQITATLDPKKKDK